MFQYLKFYGFYFLFISLCVSCGNDDLNDDECTKVVTIPQAYFSGGQSYSYDIEQEVPCDFPEPENLMIIEPPELANFSYEILSFNIVPDTGNNTRTIEFEILLNNPNNFEANGIVALTFDIGDGTLVTSPYSQLATNPCDRIDANSSCIFKVFLEESLDLVPPDNSFEILDVKYYLTSN